jgi:hypothetical protein
MSRCICALRQAVSANGAKQLRQRNAFFRGRKMLLPIIARPVKESTKPTARDQTNASNLAQRGQWLISVSLGHFNIKEQPIEQ